MMCGLIKWMLAGGAGGHVLLIMPGAAEILPWYEGFKLFQRYSLLCALASTVVKLTQHAACVLRQRAWCLPACRLLQFEQPPHALGPTQHYSTTDAHTPASTTHCNHLDELFNKINRQNQPARTESPHQNDTLPNISPCLSNTMPRARSTSSRSRTTPKSSPNLPTT